MPEPTRSPQRVATGRILLDPADSPPRNAPGTRREYDCVFLVPGRVKTVTQEPSNWLIPAEVVQRDAAKFDSVASYIDHADWFSDPSVRDLVGVTFDTHWSDEEGALVGKLRLYDEDPNSAGAFIGALIDQILADRARGNPVPSVGLSASFYHSSAMDEEAGLRITTAFKHVESIDFVYDAGAGGYVRAALAAIGREGNARTWNIQSPIPNIQTGAELPPPERSNTMPEEVNASETGGTPAAAPPPEPQAAPQAQVIQMPQELNARLEALSGQVERLTSIVAAQEHPVQGMGEAPREPRIHGMLTSLDQVEEALGALIEGRHPREGVAPLTGLRELYILLSGDYEMTSKFYPDRIGLANVNSSTMAALVANRLNKVVMATFAEYPKWWTPIVSEMDFSTLQDVRWITLGGVSDLPTVTEGSAYTELTWDDNTETASFVKKGGYLGLTIEAMDKDDTRRLRMAPAAIAQAAWLALSKDVSDIFTYNSGVGHTLADSIALFNASHSNLGTTALSHAAWVATRLAMRKQTQLHNTERLGALTAPKFLLVPPDLENTALQVLATEEVPGSSDWNINPWAEGDGRETRLRSARSRVIVVDLWTDTNNWAAVADPNKYPSIGIGYRYGRTPEIFSVASPTAGLMFSNDVMPIKVRYFYATGAVDYRGLYKHNVS